MTTYALYVESGPKRRKTMVHVLDMLGCIAQGPTTEAALEATPDAIRAYLRFLRGHGESVDPGQPFTTTVVQHVMEGDWIGNGDPTPGFAWDFHSLASDDLAAYLRRLAWLLEGLRGTVRGLPPEALVAKPQSGRAIHAILEHIAEAQGAFLRYLVGSKVEGLREAINAVKRSPQDAGGVLGMLGGVCIARLEGLTEDERTRPVPHGAVTCTARRAMRRMLEHPWEHLREIVARLDRAVA